MRDHSDAPEVRKREVVDRIVMLFESWHNAKPNSGYDTRAAEWRKKLNAKRGDSDPSSKEPKSVGHP